MYVEELPEEEVCAQELSVKGLWVTELCVKELYVRRVLREGDLDAKVSCVATGRWRRAMSCHTCHTKGTSRRPSAPPEPPPKVPRLPHKSTNDGTKYHACHKKRCLPYKRTRQSYVWQSCVKERCVKVVWKHCAWKSCVWQSCVWKSCVICVGKLCVKELCERCVWKNMCVQTEDYFSPQDWLFSWYFRPIPFQDLNMGFTPQRTSFSFKKMRINDQPWGFLWIFITFFFFSLKPNSFPIHFFFNTAPMARFTHRISQDLPKVGRRHRWHLNLQDRIALREGALRQRQVAQPDDAHGDQTWLPRRLPLQKTRRSEKNVRNRCFMMFTFHWDKKWLRVSSRKKVKHVKRAIWCYMMLYDAIWCYMMLYDVIWCYIWCYMMLYDAIWVSAKRNFCSNPLISLISLEEYLKQRKHSQDSSSWTGNPWRISLVHHELGGKRSSGASDWSGDFESPRFRLHMLNSCEFLGIFIPSRPQTIQTIQIC